MNTYAYLRVSTSDQAERMGLTAQEDACRKVGTLTQVFRDEGVSGATPLHKRPGLLAAISTLRKDDILVVAKRDRLGRDTIIVAMVEAAVSRKGARIVSAAGEGNGDTPSDQLMRRLVDAFAEYERAIIRARTSDALASKRRRGERTGHIPFGYKLARDGTHLEPSSHEQKLLKRIRAMRKADLSWRDIAKAIGSHPRTGRPWDHSQLLRLGALKENNDA
jgi:DNA invertase Pin-like site-specific DNA recombinase